MLKLAKARVPGATFSVGDMTKLKLNEDSFDGIVSTYAVFHVPRSDHFKLFLDFHRILKKGGVLLFNVGASLEGVEGIWDFKVGDGAPMFWSFYDPEKTVEVLKSADFEIIFARNAEIQTKFENQTHFWILARAK